MKIYWKIVHVKMIFLLNELKYYTMLIIESEDIRVCSCPFVCLVCIIIMIIMTTICNAHFTLSFPTLHFAFEHCNSIRTRVMKIYSSNIKGCQQIYLKSRIFDLFRDLLSNPWLFCMLKCWNMKQHKLHNGSHNYWTIALYLCSISCKILYEQMLCALH